jgi:hypothetical protein
MFQLTMLSAVGYFAIVRVGYSDAAELLDDALARGRRDRRAGRDRRSAG